MPSLRQLAYYVGIVDAGSYSLAAEHLHIAQSALSRQIRLLEDDVGVPLLLRHARHIEMTPAGRALYADARRLLDDVDGMTRQARRIGQGQQGTLGLLHSSSVALTPPLLALLRQYLADRPGLSLSIGSAASDEQAADIDAGRADIGLARAPLLRQHPDIIVRPWFQEPLVAVVAPDHPLARRERVALASLQHERFVSLPHPQRGGLSYRVVQLCTRAGFFPHGAAAVSRKATLLRLVAAGFGIALVPASMARDAGAALRALALADADTGSEVVLLHRRRPPAAVRELVDSLAAYRPGEPA